MLGTGVGSAICIALSEVTVVEDLRGSSRGRVVRQLICLTVFKRTGAASFMNGASITEV